MIKRVLLLVFLGISVLVVGKSADLKLDATLSRKEVKVGESFAYRIIIKVSSQKLPELALPQFHNFRLIAQSSQQNYVIKGRETEVSLILKLELVALKEGKFTLPPASVKYKGKIFKTPSLEVEVRGKIKKPLPPPQNDIEKGAVSI